MIPPSQGVTEALISLMKAKEDPEEKPIDNRVRTDWNKYVDWLVAKGLKGHPSLDKNDLGNKMIDAYKKENPDTVLSREVVIPLQKEFQKYRQYSLDEIKAGRGKFSDGADENNFMRALSIVDGVPGQRTTSFKFPKFYIDKFAQAKNIGTFAQAYAVPPLPR